jgi:HK97 family phage prohead protease
MTVESFDRAVTGPVEMVDDHTLHGMVVPWGQPARVMDPDSPAPYLEQFDRAAFNDQLDYGADNRGIIRNVTLRDSHDGAPLGYALELDRRDDGLYGTFRVRDAHIRDVRQMYDDGIDGLSVRFHPLARGGSRTDGGVTTRLRAIIEHVALVATPAYTSAKVLAVRADRALDIAEADRAAAAHRELAELDGWLAESRAKRLRWTSLVGDTSP